MHRSRLLLLLGTQIAMTIAGCGGGAGDPGGSGAAGGAGAGAGASSGPGASSSASSSASSGAGPACADAVEHTGDGTYYDADGSGNCSFDPTGDLMVGAMNHTDYGASAACGACAHLVGPSGEITVRIVDQCPECKPGDIDLSPQAFMGLADLSLGRVTIHWKYVACDPPGPIRYHFKEGSNQWWTAVQIRDSRFAIAKFEVQKSGTWTEVARLDYNYFVDDTGMGTGPYSFRVTDVEGNVLEDTGIPFVEAGDSTGAAQFPACSP